MQGKPSRKIIAVGVVAFVGFAVVMGAVEYLTYRGQVEFGRHYFHLSGGRLVFAYLALQGSMLTSAALAMWAVLMGRPYGRHQLWTAITLAAACVADYLGAAAAGWPVIGAAFTAGFSVLALRSWHAVLRLISARLSDSWTLLRYPLLRWVMAFGETRAAFRLSYLDDLSPGEALSRVRGELAPPRELLTADGQDVRRLSKTDAIKAAFAAIGGYDVPAAIDWLSQRGVTANRSTFYDVQQRLAAERRAEMHTVVKPSKAVKAPPAVKALPAAPEPAAAPAPVKKSARPRKAAKAGAGTPEVTVRQVS